MTCYTAPLTGTIWTGAKNLIGSVQRTMNASCGSFLKFLAYYKLSLKPEKCKMFVTRVKFCGHLLTPGGRHRDAEKVAAIERWRKEGIANPTHLKGFLGFTQWYSVYMHDYARMAAPW